MIAGRGELTSDCSGSLHRWWLETHRPETDKPEGYRSFKEVSPKSCKEGGYQGTVLELFINNFYFCELERLYSLSYLFLLTAAA